MAQIKELTSGRISPQLVKLAIPVILTSFVQMSYNFVDMALLGKLGSESVSAVGTAFYFLWFGRALVFFTKIGGEIMVSQSIGRGDREEAIHYIRNANTTAWIVSIAYALLLFLFASELVQIFGIENEEINKSAIVYLKIVAIGLPLTLTNLSFTGLYNGIGNTKVPLLVTTVGLGLNLLLDPFLILGWGVFPKLGVAGAAWATVASQVVVYICFLLFLYTKSPFATRQYFLHYNKIKIHAKYLKDIAKVGMPLSLQMMLFASFTMVIAKIVVMVAHGDGRPISVQSVGAQIEALSWMTASGLATALGSFTGQNFGANNWHRIRKGFYITLQFGLVIGASSTVLFFFFGDEIFSLFIDSSEHEIHNLGVVYLLIVAFSQVFMCIEIVSSGVFNGIGRSVPVAIVGISFNALRIPIALILSGSLAWTLPQFTRYIPNHLVPITGVWWAFTITSFFKGIVLFSWFFFLMKRRMKNL